MFTFTLVLCVRLFSDVEELCPLGPAMVEPTVFVAAFRFGCAVSAPSSTEVQDSVGRRPARLPQQRGSMSQLLVPRTKARQVPDWVLSLRAVRLSLDYNLSKPSVGTLN